VAARAPIARERVPRAQCLLDLAGREQEVQRRVEVVVVAGEPLDPFGLPLARELRLGAVGELGEPVRVAAPDRVGVAASVEPLECVLANGLERRDPGLRRPFNALEKVVVDQGFDQLQHVLARADRFDRLDRRPSDEDGHLAEEALLVRIEQLVAPVERGPKRPLPRREVARPLAEHVEGPGEAGEELFRPQQLRSRRSQLDRQGSPSRR
jgi:hypothetical protein